MSDMNNYRNDFLNGIKAAQGLPQGPNQPPRVEQGGPGMINCTNDNRPGIYSNLQGNMVFSPDSVHAIKPGMEAIPQTQPPMYNHPIPQQQMPMPQQPEEGGFFRKDLWEWVCLRWDNNHKCNGRCISKCSFSKDLWE